MGSILFWLGALVVVSVLSPVLKLLIAAVAGKHVGAAALAKQPDTIHLDRRDGNVWKNGVAVRKVADPLLARGFEDAGTYAVREMPGLTLQLLAHAGDSFYAAIYEHPVAGVWYDLASRFQDGTSYTLATSKPTGLDPRPGHTVVNCPGMSVNAALDQALTERPRKWFETVSADRAVAFFEKAYAESMAWRKQRGVSRREVVNSTLKRAA